MDKKVSTINNQMFIKDVGAANSRPLLIIKSKKMLTYRKVNEHIFIFSLYIQKGIMSHHHLL